MLEQLVLVACLSGCAPAPQHPTLSAVVGDQLVDAIQRHDIATLVAMLRAPVPFGGLWFADPACRAQFPTETNIRPDQVRAFATCLAGLPLVRSPRTHVLDDVTVLQYEPGFEVEVEFVEGFGRAWIGWIGYASQRAPRDALPTVTGAVLDRLRVDARPLVIDPATAAALDAGRHHVPKQYAWLKVCLDATGVVTGVHAREATSPLAADTFVAEARTWRFRAFEVGGQAIPMCGMKRLAYPESDAPELLPIATLPGASDEPRITLVELTLVEGTHLISPDAEDKTRIAKAGSPRIYAAIDVCFNATGTVTSVELLSRSGLPHYDAKLLAAARLWRFEPVVEGGRPIASCSIAKFVYSQR